MKPLILASSSPRRQEILQQLGLSFTVQPSNTDEQIEASWTPAQIVEQLSLRKAGDVAKTLSQGLVIGSDTIVVVDDQVLGKPHSKDDALHMLRLLQGRTHYVYSGLVVLNVENGDYRVGHSRTKVYMRDVSDEELQMYIDTGEPMDKAGSYAVQGISSVFIEKIEGDYFSVVGLPIRLLDQFLTSFGQSVLQRRQAR